jgi:hypothetical protein
VAEAELEEKFRKARHRREREQYEAWRCSQQSTLHEWGVADCQQARRSRAHDTFDRIRIRRDLERRQHEKERLASDAQRRMRFKRDVSRKLQQKYEREEAEARSKLAALESQPALAVLLQPRKSVVAVPPVAKPRTSAPHPRLSATSSVLVAPSPARRYTVTFNASAAMGLTLQDRKNTSPACSREDEQTRLAEYSASVLRLDDPDEPAGQARRLGVRLGDILCAVNGQDVADMHFSDVCACISSAPQPRRLSFFH